MSIEDRQREVSNLRREHQVTDRQLALEEARRGMRVPSSAKDVFQERGKIRIDQITSLGVADTQVTGVLYINGAGEQFKDVFFAVSFLDRPSFSYGLVVPDGVSLTSEHWPMCSLQVLNWITKEVNEGQHYYVGCRFGGLAIGLPTLKMEYHWQMRGKAFRNPIGSSDQVI